MERTLKIEVKAKYTKDSSLSPEAYWKVDRTLQSGRTWEACKDPKNRYSNKGLLSDELTFEYAEVVTLRIEVLAHSVAWLYKKIIKNALSDLKELGKEFFEENDWVSSTGPLPLVFVNGRPLYYPVDELTEDEEDPWFEATLTLSTEKYVAEDELEEGEEYDSDCEVEPEPEEEDYSDLFTERTTMNYIELSEKIHQDLKRIPGWNLVTMEKTPQISRENDGIVFRDKLMRITKIQAKTTEEAENFFESYLNALKAYLEKTLQSELGFNRINGVFNVKATFSKQSGEESQLGIFRVFHDYENKPTDEEILNSKSSIIS